NLLNIEFVIVNNGDRTISYEVDKLHVSLNKKKLVFERVARDSKTYFGSKNSKVVELKKASKKFIIPAGRRIKINYSLKTKNPDEVITLNSPIRVSNSGFIINRKRDKLSFNLNPKN
ncbi:MAG: hypothetical protein HOM21_03055, partial [Halobacteriovoraceae bacterium]|nr:hypothetical protein [Halobacteriovoraceae bacterium]